MRVPDDTPEGDAADAVSRRLLDELLFCSTSWFAIDAANTRVRGVCPGGLQAGLALVGRGAVASIVGRLRSGVVGLDVDAAGGLGDLAAEAVADWCDHRGLWHIRRASGGGRGRWHVIVVPGVHREALTIFVESLRAEMRLSRTALDLRDALRPLSAPHRRTGRLGELHAPDDALERLRDIQGSAVAIAAGRAHPAAAVPPQRGSGPGEALVPLPRPRRDLPQAWRDYLTSGRDALGDADPDPSTRSLTELAATTQMVVAGWSEDQAWEAITTAHRTAFTKARARGRRWWRWTWNRAVSDADAWLARARRAVSHAPSSRLSQTEQARNWLWQVWLSWPARTRHTDREVLLVILDRMDRVGSAAVGIPQRDLLCDAAVTSRTTVRASLTRLQAVGALEIEATYRPGTTDTSHTLALPRHLTERRALPVNDPPRFEPPLRGPAPLPLRRGLGLARSQLWTHLPQVGQSRVKVEDLALAAGFGAVGAATASARTLRTVRAHLVHLAAAGLAEVDEMGCWWALDVGAGVLAVQVAGGRADDEVRAQVSCERMNFRTVVDPHRRRARWEMTRQAAVARSRKALRARQKAWWMGLDPDERQECQQTRSRAFALLSAHEQASLKWQWAHSRALAGEHEATRYAQWLASLPDAELDERSVLRAVAWARRPSVEQQQLVAAWASHRQRWNLPGPTRKKITSESPERELVPVVVDLVEAERARPTSELILEWLSG